VLSEPDLIDACNVELGAYQHTANKLLKVADSRKGS
jgi:hypothetical protein